MKKFQTKFESHFDIFIINFSLILYNDKDVTS